VSARGSTLVGAALLGLLVAAAGLAAAAALREAPAERWAAARTLAAALALSDPALFTEARYSRNPVLADLHTAFQDGPASLEHFPSGSLVAPPRAFPAGRLESGDD
jgi:hypothetical protein